MFQAFCNGRADIAIHMHAMSKAQQKENTGNQFNNSLKVPRHLSKSKSEESYILIYVQGWGLHLGLNYLRNLSICRDFWHPIEASNHSVRLLSKNRHRMFGYASGVCSILSSHWASLGLQKFGNPKVTVCSNWKHGVQNHRKCSDLSDP